MGKNELGRRYVLKKSAIALSSLAVSSTAVSASTHEPGPSLRSEGIESEITKLQEAGNHQKVSQVLSEYGIPHGVTEKQISSDGSTVDTASLHQGETLENNSGSSVVVSPQEEYDYNASTFTRTTILADSTPDNDAADYWRIGLSWVLDTGNPLDGTLESASPPDGIQISGSDSNWTHDSPKARAYCEGPTVNTDINTKIRGVGARFDDPDTTIEPNGKRMGGVQTYFWRKNTDIPYMLFSTYRHAWTHATDSLSITYAAVPFGFTVGFDTDFWEVQINHQISPDNTVTENRRYP
ncbi:hypothetical protein U3A55_02985 [Salarchaeum sp. III]|uniref:hypothetical protein n=1 Tax=Salarchaeum sp. III TaxID=3107927 RepID=UPI002ED92F0D